MHDTTRRIGKLGETVAQVKSIAGAVSNAVVHTSEAVTDEAKISSCSAATLSPTPLFHCPSLPWKTISEASELAVD